MEQAIDIRLYFLVPVASSAQTLIGIVLIKHVVVQSVVVVAGGVGEFDENLRSIELLQEGDSKWVLGQDLPTPIRDSVMITDQHGAAVIIGGLSPDAYYVGQVANSSWS